ncbi:hypothetical protein [Intestinimonas massiliensis (ex Afouda et al. 2020)]|uniref:hypothetical protein n=1 Tax=Intestinimonas massiliensis (ex Afouda et al. 2020) TaxID=1673721 RepID=UPI00102F4A62|nr:hypothetical protein [Intestinimonas massiliensis (ex Afouda et al. 2020)]
MSDRPEDNRPQEEEREPYTPASPIKRILAWVGIVYMVCLIFLNLYPFFNQGAYLTGVAPLFACPGIAGLLAIALWTLRQPDETYSKKASMGVLALVCVVGLVVSLVLGIPPLLANFS